MAKYTVSLHLSNNKKAETEILFDVHGEAVEKKRFRVSSGIRVKKINWNIEKYEIRKGASNYSDNNLLLRKYKGEIEQACTEAILQNIPITSHFVKSRVNFVGVKEKRGNFYDAYDTFVEFKRGTIARNTLLKYTLLKREIQLFAEKKSVNISFEAIDENFDKAFKEYLYETGRQDGGIHNYFTKLKAFLKWSAEKGFHRNMKYKKFRIPNHEPQLYPLTIDELRAFEKLKLTENKALVKDLFLFQCYTGLRISDVMNLRNGNVQGHYIRDLTLKTKEKVFIPLIPRSERIIKKYQKQSRKTGFVFPRLSFAKIGKHLKNIGKEAGLIYNVSKVIVRGIEREEKTLPRYEMLGTNDARRTFITMSLSRGVSAQMLMRITGHTKSETLQRYVRFSEDDITDQIKFVWNKIK